jgi:hypothetical protein
MRWCSLPATELRGQHPVYEILLHRQVVEPVIFFRRQQGECVPPGEDAGAVTLGHTVRRRPFVGVVHADAKQARRRLSFS